VGLSADADGSGVPARGLGFAFCVFPRTREGHMPRRSILTPTELAALLAVPTSGVELVRRFELSERDLAVISGHRGRANRLGFAVQLAYMRFPGVNLGAGDEPDVGVLRVVADQVGVPPSEWAAYGQRGQTRREHLVDLQRLFGFRSFTIDDHQAGGRRAR
jgi:TnpA family transposase